MRAWLESESPVYRNCRCPAVEVLRMITTRQQTRESFSGTLLGVTVRLGLRCCRYAVGDKPSNDVGIQRCLCLVYVTKEGSAEMNEIMGDRRRIQANGGILSGRCCQTETRNRNRSASGLFDPIGR